MKDTLTALFLGLAIGTITFAIGANSCKLDVRPTINKPRSGDVIVWQSCEPPCCDIDEAGQTEFDAECQEP